MKPGLQDERGIALAIAIYTLVVVGALVAGAFFAGTQEQRVGQNSKRVQQSFGVAEAGLAERLSTWAPDSINLVAQYPDDSVRVNMSAAPGGTGSYGGWIYRLNNELFLIDVTGSDAATLAGQTQAGSGARQRIGLLTRLRPINFDIQASLTTQGDVTLAGNAEVSGIDQNPTGWIACGPEGPAVAGVRNQEEDAVSGDGKVKGSPAVVHDSTLADSSFTNFDGTTYADLAARATITLPGGNYKTEPSFTNGQCNKADPLNWGDGLNPSSTCGNYFPIVHLTGSATLNGTQGQGILLVDGDLNVQGSYEWYGITIIQGQLGSAGGGKTDAHFWGGVLARNANLAVDLKLSGKATLNYSSCSIQRALQATSIPTMMRSRGWVQLY